MKRIVWQYLRWLDVIYFLVSTQWESSTYTSVASGWICSSLRAQAAYFEARPMSVQIFQSTLQSCTTDPRGVLPLSIELLLKPRQTVLVQWNQIENGPDDSWTQNDWAFKSFGSPISARPLCVYWKRPRLVSFMLQKIYTEYFQLNGHDTKSEFELLSVLVWTRF